MIVATKSVDSMVKGVVSSDKLTIAKVESISTSIQLDPEISSPKKELFIISNDDLKSPRLRIDFIESLKSKHPKAKILFIAKNRRVIPGLDLELFTAVLNSPSKPEVSEAIVELTKELESKGEYEISDEIGDVAPLDIAAIEVSTPSVTAESNNTAEPSVQSAEPTELELDNTPVQKKQVEHPEEPELVRRIRESESWAKLTSVTSEIQASKVVNEIINSNATFKQTEMYISSLNENIAAILANPEYDVSTRLNKVRALLHDKSIMRAKTNSHVEQMVETIVRSVIDKAKEEVETKTASLDEQLTSALVRSTSADAPNLRLSTIIEKRSKLLLDLSAMDLEIKNMASKLNETVNETLDRVIEDSSSTTNSPLLDNQMRHRYGTIVPENLIQVIDSLLSLGKDSSNEFGEMSDKVHSVLNKVYALLYYYQEEVDILGDTIRYLKANNIEDTIIGKSVLKKSMRMFIVNNDFNSTLLSYMCSKRRSRTNANVLHLDLTGFNSLFDQCNIKYYDLDSFMGSKPPLKDFLSIVATPSCDFKPDSDENCELLMTKLLEYSKHYSVINIVCTSEQKEFISSFKEEVLSVTYMVDCLPQNISIMRDCIKETKVNNTANKVVLVNCIGESSKMCEQLNVLDFLDFQLVTLPPIDNIRYCVNNAQDPSEVQSIVKDCEELFKVC